MPYTNADVTAGSATGGRIKVLILAPPKAGKTVLAVKTSPGPVFVVNADPGGLTSAVGLGAKFEAEDVFDYATLSKTLNYLKGKKSTYKTIVIDTLTLLSQSLEADLKRKGLESWELFRELKDQLLGTVGQIIALPCHVILTAHAIETSADAGSMGILPAMSGQAKTLLPALCQDWLWLEVSPDKSSGTIKRELLLGAQGNWKHGCRSIQNGGRMEANMTAFIKKAGLKP